MTFNLVFFSRFLLESGAKKVFITPPSSCRGERGLAAGQEALMTKKKGKFISFLLRAADAESTCETGESLPIFFCGDVVPPCGCMKQLHPEQQ